MLSNFSVEVKMIYNYGFDLITQQRKQRISDYKERITQELAEIEEWEKTEFKLKEENKQNDNPEYFYHTGENILEYNKTKMLKFSKKKRRNRSMRIRFNKKKAKSIRVRKRSESRFLKKIKEKEILLV